MKIILNVVLVLATLASFSQAQFPPRIQIPGALYLDSPAPQKTRSRSRTPPQNIATSYAREVRPVNEEPDDIAQDNVARLAINTQRPLQQQQQQQLIEIEPETEVGGSPIQFRPQDAINPPVQARQEAARQIPFSPTIRPVTRQELKQQIPSYQPQITRQQLQQQPQEIPHLRRVQQQQPVNRPVQRPVARPAPQYLDEDDGHRTRKPPVQILRKYRTDNADGSITWGYENEDGSFKEETIGVDCITRGKYGYVDPDGVKREYTYETGGTCEEPEEELEDLPPGGQQHLQQQPKNKKPLRPPQIQYVNN